ncbi:unnamed protein product [Calypogeia fissa]
MCDAQYCCGLMDKLRYSGIEGGAAPRLLTEATMSMFTGPAIQFSLASSCNVDELVQPSSEDCEAYALYLHLPHLSHLRKRRSWPGWSSEPLIRPALHGLELVFRMISSVFCDHRAYIDKGEWLRRLEGLANAQLELISLICEGDSNAPTVTMQQQSAAVSPTPSSSQKATGPKPHNPVKSSRESLLARMATWKMAQGLVTRLHLATEAHMSRVPFTLGLGEPNLSGKPVLEYDKICTPSEVYACLQAAPGSPEDHALATAHQIVECWLVVAQGLVKIVEEKVSNGNSGGAADKCWILERIWKLFTSTMDLLQVMDPDDFMKLKQTLAIKPKPGSSTKPGPSAGHGAVAFCLRSTMLRTVTKACKELRSLVPKVVGVEVDPKGGPRLQEAIMELFNSHGQRTRGYPYDRPNYAHQSGTIHLLQAFQAIEVAIRQFYFSYRLLVITIMGSGEYTGAIQSEISGADVLQELYSEPPYFPSIDGARTFLGDFWHHKMGTEQARKCMSPPRSAIPEAEGTQQALAATPQQESIGKPSESRQQERPQNLTIRV